LWLLAAFGFPTDLSKQSTAVSARARAPEQIPDSAADIALVLLDASRRLRDAARHETQRYVDKRLARIGISMLPSVPFFVAPSFYH
jgi:hypothetical protein